MKISGAAIEKKLETGTAVTDESFDVTREYIDILGYLPIITGDRLEKKKIKFFL